MRIIKYFTELLATLKSINQRLQFIENELHSIDRRCDARFRGDEWHYKRSFP